MKQEEIYEKDDEIREDLIQAASEIGRAELKHRFGKLEGIEDHQVVKKSLKLWWAVAAIGAILLASILFLKPKSPDALYAANYSKFKNSSVAVTRGSNEKDDLKIAMIAYTQGDYEEALTQLRILERTYPEVKIYEGIIALENENFIAASKILQPLSINANYKFQHDASWYLALTYLKIDNKEAAKSILQELSTGNSFRAEKAGKLLKKL